MLDWITPRRAHIALFVFCGFGALTLPFLVIHWWMDGQPVRALWDAALIPVAVWLCRHYWKEQARCVN